MADTKLSNLTADATPTTDDITYVVNDPGGTPVSRKVTLANIAILVWNYLTSLTAKTTPVDADQLGIADSAAANVGKKVTLANFAAYIYNYLTSLTAKTTPVDADQLAIADSAASNTGKKVTLANFAAYIYNYLTSLTAKTTLVDADQLTLADSAASNAGKKITWANVMVQILAYTGTFTNKRVTPRTGSTTSSATPTINTDNVDFYHLTAQAVDITSFTTNLSGTPTTNQKLWIAITGTAARAITWGTSFEAGAVALPTTTTTTQRLDVGFIWNAVTSKWRCMASGSA